MIKALTNTSVACVGCVPIQGGFLVGIVTLKNPLPNGLTTTLFDSDSDRQYQVTLPPIHDLNAYSVTITTC